VVNQRWRAVLRRWCGGALAGRGADLFVIDDPHSEQDIKANSRATFDNAWSWFQTGPLQRLMPDGRVIVVMTRWSLIDLTGKLINFQIKNPESDPWEIVELPAILPSGKSLWPEQWPVEQLEQKRTAMDPGIGTRSTCSSPPVRGQR
jgi:hypothetical protein